MLDRKDLQILIKLFIPEEVRIKPQCKAQIRKIKRFDRQSIHILYCKIFGIFHLGGERLIMPKTRLKVLKVAKGLAKVEEMKDEKVD